MTDYAVKGNNSNLPAIIGRYIKLLIEDTRLGLAEKLTRLLTAVTMSALLLLFALMVLVFTTIGVSILLAPVVSPSIAFFIVASFYVVLIVILIVFRRQLVENPIARFISFLIVEPPSKPHTPANDKPTTVS